MQFVVQQIHNKSKQVEFGLRASLLASCQGTSARAIKVVAIERRNTDLDVHSQRHDENSNHDVGDCQRRYEVIGGGVQRFLVVDAEADEQVAEDRADGKDEQQHAPVAGTH